MVAMLKDMGKDYKYEFVDGLIPSDLINKVVFRSNCCKCKKEHHMGFMIKGEKMPGSEFRLTLNFICLDCSVSEIEEVECQKELGLFDLDIVKRYGYIYNQFLRNRLSEEKYEEFKIKYEKYIDDKLIETIEELYQLTLEHEKNVNNLTVWKGYWQGVTGTNFNDFIEALLILKTGSSLKNAKKYGQKKAIKIFKEFFNK